MESTNINQADYRVYRNTIYPYSNNRLYLESQPIFYIYAAILDKSVV